MSLIKLVQTGFTIFATILCILSDHAVLSALGSSSATLMICSMVDDWKRDEESPD